MIHPTYQDDLTKALREEGLPATITVTKNILTKGGFSELYRGQTTTGEPVIVKILKPAEQFHGDQEENQRRIDCIMQNVRDKQPILDKDTFTTPTFIPEKGQWYVMQHYPGSCLSEEIERGRVEPKHLYCGATAYANMLKRLHQQDMVFYDNNWGAVLVNDESARICDFDFLSTLKDLETPWHYARPIATRGYSAREQLLCATRAPLNTIPPITPSVDLEGFALMLDHAYNGDAFTDKNELSLGFTIEDAKKNQRSYPKARARNLPPGLHDVLPRLIEYPRAQDLTIDDIIEALAIAHS